MDVTHTRISALLLARFMSESDDRSLSMLSPTKLFPYQKTPPGQRPGDRCKCTNLAVCNRQEFEAFLYGLRSDRSANRRRRKCNILTSDILLSGMESVNQSCLLTTNSGTYAWSFANAQITSELTGRHYQWWAIATYQGSAHILRLREYNHIEVGAALIRHLCYTESTMTDNAKQFLVIATHNTVRLTGSNGPRWAAVMPGEYSIRLACSCFIAGDEQFRIYKCGVQRCAQPILRSTDPQLALDHMQLKVRRWQAKGQAYRSIPQN